MTGHGRAAVTASAVATPRSELPRGRLGRDDVRMHLLRRLAAAAVLPLALAACAEPIPSATDPAGASPPPAEPTVDPRRAAVDRGVQALADTVAAADRALQDATGADDLDEARDRAAVAVATLTAAEELVPAGAEPAARPLFPGPETSREETIDHDDVLSELLTAARAAGDESGALLSLLREPVAGDVSVWQRDPASQLDAIAAAAAAGDEESVLALEGEGCRALAWAIAAAEAATLEDAHAHATRGSDHLTVVLDLIETVRGAQAGPSPGTGPSPETPS